MFSKMNIYSLLTSWKIHLESQYRQHRNRALMEMCDMFNSLNEEETDRVSIFLINSEICHFLEKIMGIHDEFALNMINKIICHLSDTDEFFKHDFFRIMKGFVRIFNSFTEKGISNINQEEHHNSFICASLVMKRARARECNFKDRQIPLNTLLTSVSGLHRDHLGSVTVLEFVDLTVQFIHDTPTQDIRTAKFRGQKLYELAKKLVTRKANLDSTAFTLLLSKILLNLLHCMPSQDQTSKQKGIINTVIDKFLALMDSYVWINEFEKSEIFYITFYHLLTSEQLQTCDKAILINRFFVLDGVDICIHHINNINDRDTDKFFKERVILSEVFNTFLKCMQLVSDDSLREECYNIVFGANLRLELFPSVENTNTETILMYIFVKYVGYKWKKPNFKKNEVLCGLSLLLASRKAQELTVYPAFMSLLTTLFTSTFVNVSIKGNLLLQMASTSLLAMNPNKLPNIEYMNWWNVTAIPKKLELNNAGHAFLSRDIVSQELGGLKTEDLQIFDRSFLIKILLSSRSSLKEKQNAKQIICTAPGLFTNDFQKMLRKLKRLCSTCYESIPNESTLSIIIEVLEQDVGYFQDHKIVKETSLVMIQVLMKPTISKDSKLAAVRMTKTLMCIRK